MSMKKVYLSALVLLCAVATASATATVLERARELPVAYDVDVVVVGGSTRAVRTVRASVTDSLCAAGGATRL